MLILANAVVSICVGSLKQFHVRWALWPGVLLFLEIILRCTIHVCWLKLPETVVGKCVRKWLREHWPKFRTQFNQLRQLGVHENLERVPFSEDQVAENWWTEPAHIFSRHLWKAILRDRLGFKPLKC